MFFAQTNSQRAGDASASRCIDPVLLPLLRSSSPSEANRQMECLLLFHAGPIIEAAVQRNVVGPPTFRANEAAEVRAETTARLIHRLHALSFDAKPIGNFGAYVKTTATHVCWNRRQAARREPPVSTLHAARENEYGEAYDITDAAFSRDDTHINTESVQFLLALWAEVKQLPSTQRVALMLHFRVTDGRNGIRALLQAGLAGEQEIARALDLSPGEWDALLLQLPMSDADIGKRLGKTIVEVYNLRRVARTRLARRLRDWL